MQRSHPHGTSNATIIGKHLNKLLVEIKISYIQGDQLDFNALIHHVEQNKDKSLELQKFFLPYPTFNQVHTHRRLCVLSGYPLSVIYGNVFQLPNARE